MSKYRKNVHKTCKIAIFGLILIVLTPFSQHVKPAPILACKRINTNLMCLLRLVDNGLNTYFSLYFNHLSRCCECLEIFRASETKQKTDGQKKAEKIGKNKERGKKHIFIYFIYIFSPLSLYLCGFRLVETFFQFFSTNTQQTHHIYFRAPFHFF